MNRLGDWKIRVKPLSSHILFTMLFFLCMAMPLYAAEIIRDRGLIMATSVEGVSLNMTPKQAFDHLASNGFKAGNIVRFDDWTTPGIVFRKEGALKPSGYPKWYIEINLGRTEGRLTSITEYSQKLDRTNYNIGAEIDQLRSYFSISEDEPNCKYSEHGGACSVIDSENRSLVFGMQVKRTTKSTQITIYSR
ncbi:MAG: hypothetical protein KZQ77_15070 [Candidatus Thiodiazotropha sp. (ex Notomyrtea botanica)]|nr:hypothetical protein [Candidatus Thiodiazotropha sp. (ex Notomyrtea botanica)]